MAADKEGFSELMLRVRQGDADALQLVLDEYGEAIRREVRFTLLDTRLRRFVGDSDIYQSVIFRFFSNMREGDYRVETPTDLVRLLKGITRTRVAELVRFWHAQRRDLSRNVSDELVPPSDLAATDGQPDRLLAEADLAAAVQQRLSPRDKEILQFREDGMNWSEIAARTGAASGEAARKRHWRALARIIAEFGGT